MRSHRIRFLVLPPLLLTVTACDQKPFAIDHVQENTPVRRNTVFIDDHGWHTGFIVPAADMNTDLPFLTKRFAPVPFYYELGWGDKGFYQSHEITTGLTLRAMLWSSGSVVHVVAVTGTPFDYFPNSEIVPVSLSDSEYADLRRFIKASFAYDAQGAVMPLQHGIYGDSQFYEGSGTYYIFNTCNKWTAKGLKSAGMDISTPFKLTAGSVMGYLHDHAGTHTGSANTVQ